MTTQNGHPAQLPAATELEAFLPVTNPVLPADPEKLLEVARTVAYAGIQGPEHRAGCERLMLLIRSVKDSVELHYKPASEQAHARHKYIVATRNQYLDLLHEAERLLQSAFNALIAPVTTDGLAVTLPPAAVDGSLDVAKGRWKLNIVDLNAVPREYLMVDEKKALATIRQSKRPDAIPGILGYREAKVKVEGPKPPPLAADAVTVGGQS